MNKELKNKWISALRSGEYQQTKGALRDERGFCCIGVLCDLIDPKGWSAPFAGSRSWGPDKVVANLPLRAASPLGFGPHVEWLPTLNDRGVSFTQIADLIERDDPEQFKAACTDGLQS